MRLKSFLPWLGLLAGSLALGGCGGSGSGIVTPAPPTFGPLAFLNVYEGQTVRDVMDSSPGAVVKGEKVVSVKVQVFRPDGNRWWERSEKGAIACITGVNNGRCKSWTSNAAPDGRYTVKAIATLEGNRTVTGQVSFTVANDSPAPPPSPSPSTPPSPTPPSPTPPSPPSPPSPTPPGPQPTPQQGNRVAWKDINSWMRGDGGCNLNDVVNSKFKMVTMSARCTSRLLERADTDRVKNSGKWLLAYEDVAFAAPWDSRVWPSLVNEGSWFIKGQNQWGSWEADLTADGWYSVLEAVIRDDLSRGYDGIWLDDCAAFWTTSNASDENVLRFTNAVKRVRQIIDSIKPGALLVCNTDSELVRLSIQQNSGFLEAVDGIALEGFTYHCFGPGDCRDNDPGRRTEEEKWAQEAQKRNEKVFTLDYAYDWGQQKYAWDESKKRGWAPAVNQGYKLGAYFD